MKIKKKFDLSGVPRAVVESAATSLPVRLRKAEGGEPAELLLMETIGEDWYGDGVSAIDVVDFVRDQKGHPITVRINSPGGLVYDGMSMYNALASHDSDVTVVIEGLAYSMASVVAMAGDSVQMYKASDFGIHRAWSIVMGNQRDMRAEADWLATIDSHLVEIYAEKTGKSKEQVAGWMDGESDGTLFSATEAKEAGFADELIDPKASKKPAEDSRGSMIKQFTGRRLAEARQRLASLKTS